jgi:hypothetical protein
LPFWPGHVHPLEMNLLRNSNFFSRTHLHCSDGTVIRSKSWWRSKHYQDLLKNYEVWDYNKSNVNFLHRRLGKRVSLLRFGYAPFLETVPSNVPQDIDVLFYGSMCPRRWNIERDLRKQGINAIFRSFNLWGTERDSLIARAKIVLNIHFHSSCLFEYSRVLPLLSNRKFVISEFSSDQDEYKFLEGGLVICNYNEILPKILYFLQHPDERHVISTQGYEIVKQHPTIPPI